MRLRVVIIIVLVIAAGTVFAGGGSYPYHWHNGSGGAIGTKYNIGGATLRPGTYPAYSKTYSIHTGGTQFTSLFKLVLQTRVWYRLDVGVCPLVREKQVKGTCKNCLHAPESDHPTYSTFEHGTMEVSTNQSWSGTYMVSKHKLKHDGAHNEPHANPSPFYTRSDASLPTMDPAGWNGAGFLCGSQSLPEDPDDD